MRSDTLDQRALPQFGGRPIPFRLGSPQERRHLLEGHPGRQLGGGMTPVVGPTLAELGHAGGDGGQTALDPAPRAPASGQMLDVRQREQTPAAVRLGVRGQQPPAHVGIERRHLDAETTGSLLALQHPFHDRYLH
jgi:hypothetical protein